MKLHTKFGIRVYAKGTDKSTDRSNVVDKSIEMLFGGKRRAETLEPTYSPTLTRRFWD